MIVCEHAEGIQEEKDAASPPPIPSQPIRQSLGLKPHLRLTPIPHSR